MLLTDILYIDYAISFLLVLLLVLLNLHVQDGLIKTATSAAAVQQRTALGTHLLASSTRVVKIGLVTVIVGGRCTRELWVECVEALDALRGVARGRTCNARAAESLALRLDATHAWPLGCGA